MSHEPPAATVAADESAKHARMPAPAGLVSESTHSPRHGLVSASRVAAAKAGVRFEQMPVDLVVRHPDNRADLGDLGDLTASIAQVGVLQPIVVDEVAHVLEQRPDLAGTFGSASYVLRTGERRVAAAKAAGLRVIPAVVHLSADQAATYATFFHENTHRKGLSPVDEARIVEHLKDIGLGQKEIATMLGVSAPTVSRRLKLLQLPVEIVDLVHEGRLPSREAVEALAGLDSEHVRQAWSIHFEHGVTLTEAVQEVDRFSARAARVSEVHARLEDAGESIIESIDELRADTHRQIDADDADALRAARENGTLVALPTQWGPLYYDTAKPDALHPGKSAQEAPSARNSNPIAAAQRRSVEEEREKREKLEAKTAKAARRKAVAEMVRAPAETGEAVEALVRWAVRHRGSHYDRALLLVHEWLKADIHTGQVKAKGGREPLEDVDEWESAIVNSGNISHVQWLAWAIAVAVDEIRTSRNGIAWDRATRDYFELLWKRAAYEPTAWEQARLNQIR